MAPSSQRDPSQAMPRAAAVKKRGPQCPEIPAKIIGPVDNDPAS
jgi:hypothetical protein